MLIVNSIIPNLKYHLDLKKERIPWQLFIEALGTVHLTDGRTIELTKEGLRNRVRRFKGKPMPLYSNADSVYFTLRMLHSRNGRRRHVDILNFRLPDIVSWQVTITNAGKLGKAVSTNLTDLDLSEVISLGVFPRKNKDIIETSCLVAIHARIREIDVVSLRVPTLIKRLIEPIAWQYQ